MSGTEGNRPEAAAALEPLLQDTTRCKALLAATDAIVWTIHPGDGFVEEQPSWQAYTGQSWPQAKGNRWLDAVHPDDRQMVMRAWSAATANSDQYNVTCRVWHAESRVHRTCVVRATAIRDASGTVVEWVGAVTDVHDRPMSLPEMHRLNDALKNQLETHHRELERLFSVSLDVMLSMATDGRLVTLSPSFQAVTGYPVKDAIGQVFERFVHPVDVAKCWAEVRKVLAGEYHAIDFETRVMHAGGGVRLVSWRAVGSAAEARLYAVGRDITQQREAEERLVRAQKLESLGQLTGGISHDFNNILAAITSYLEVAKKLLHTEPKRVESLLESALGAARRGAALVSQLLSFAKRQRLAQEPVDINEMVRAMEELVSRSIGAAVNLELLLSADLKPALADRTQLEAVLLNLCINSRDAMPRGGTLTISTASHLITDDPDTRIDDLPKGEFILLSVDDTGTGMDDETLARCLEPFFTTKGPGKGTGLGLAQAVTVVQRLGGSMRLHSREGVGTKVEVVLPRASEAAIAHEQAALAVAPPSLPRATIVLVDDHKDVLSSTAELLTAHGFEVFAFDNPKEAMAFVLTSKPFDVLMTDYLMPGMTGVELINDARQLRPKLVGLLVTAATDVEALRRAAPQTTLLVKPFSTERMLKALETAVAAHRLNTGES